LQGLPKPPAWPHQNCFEGLPDEGVYEEWEQDGDFSQLLTHEHDRAVPRLPTKRRRFVGSQKTVLWAAKTSGLIWA